MKLSILLFARLREVLGQNSIVLDAPGPIAVSDLPALVAAQYPAFEPYKDFCRIAVNQAYAPDPALFIQATDEVALIPPVSGG